MIPMVSVADGDGRRSARWSTKERTIVLRQGAEAPEEGCGSAP